MKSNKFKIILAIGLSGLMISSPVFSTDASIDKNEDFSSFLEKYAEYKATSKGNNKRKSLTKISGKLNFSSDNCYGEQECKCPSGNTYLECLTGGNVFINADANDSGSMGLVAIMSDTQSGDNGAQGVINSKGQWVSRTSVGNHYTGSVKKLSGQSVYNFAVNPAPIAAACRKLEAGLKVIIMAGLGVVNPMDVEFSERMKDHPELGTDFDPERFIYTKALSNGMQQKKYTTIGTGTCRDGYRNEIGGA